MLKINRILCATDFSPCADRALTNAVFLARKYGAKLHLLHAIVLHSDYDPINPAFHFPEIDEYSDSVRNAVQEKTDNALQSHDIEKIDVVRAQERGIAAAPVILGYALDHEIDLIVMGTKGRRGLGHLFLGSVAEEVVRLSNCPVLTFHEQEQSGGIKPVRQILVPLDFSILSQKAIAYAKHIASTYQARIRLLHVFEQPIHPAFYGTSQGSVFEFMPHIQSVSKENLKTMYVDAGGLEVPFDIDVVEGRAANEILKFADMQSSDMIVMATHGLTGLASIALGSVAQRVVQMAQCPVFTIKAFGKSLIEA